VGRWNLTKHWLHWIPLCSHSNSLRTILYTTKIVDNNNDDDAVKPV